MAGKPTLTSGSPRRIAAKRGTGKPGLLQHSVDDVLSQADRRRVARRAGERNLEQLEHGDDRRLERRDAVDALAHVEGEVELGAAHLLDPLPVLVDRHVPDLVALGDERLLDRLDGAEDELIGFGGVRRRAVEQNGDLHATSGMVGAP